MTISEFQAWLEGFEEAIDDAPTPEQWAKVKEKIEGLQDISVTPTQPAYRTLGIGTGIPQTVFPRTPTTCISNTTGH